MTGEALVLALLVHPLPWFPHQYRNEVPALAVQGT